MPWTADERMFVAVMERRYELESLRRSLAMLRPGAPALDRDQPFAHFLAMTPNNRTNVVRAQRFGDRRAIFGDMRVDLVERGR